MLSNAVLDAIPNVLSGTVVLVCFKHAQWSSMMSHFTNGAPIRNSSPTEEVHRVSRMD